MILREAVPVNMIARRLTEQHFPSGLSSAGNNELARIAMINEVPVVNAEASKGSVPSSPRTKIAGSLAAEAEPRMNIVVGGRTGFTTA